MGTLIESQYLLIVSPPCYGIDLGLNISGIVMEKMCVSVDHVSNKQPI